MMQLSLGQLKAKSEDLTSGMADARSARNLMSRREKKAAAEEREAERGHRRRKRLTDREAEQALRRGVRVHVPFDDRPRISNDKTAHKLFHRASKMLQGTSGLSDARGPDGLYSLHFGFVARGFASTTGRRWRAGEAERAARYIVREDGLEGGDLGWWSNIAADRNELVAFCRTLESVERHDRKNANVYCTEIIALPAELSPKQRRRAVKRICRFFERRGLAYVVAIHVPDDAGDQRNFHCHIIYSLRRCERHGQYDWSFALSKETNINTPPGIAARRQLVVRDINTTLHAAGIQKRYTHLSNAARHMSAAQPKIGQAEIWTERRLIAMEARHELLEKACHIASAVRAVLTHNNNALTNLRSSVERALTRNRASLACAEDVRTVPRGKSLAAASMLQAAKVSTWQATPFSPLRMAKDARVSDLRNSAQAMRATCSELLTRLEPATGKYHGQLQEMRGIMARYSSPGRPHFDRVKAKLVSLMAHRRDGLSTAMAQVTARLAVTEGRSQAMSDFLSKQHLIANAATRISRCSPALRPLYGIAMERLKAIKETVGSAGQSSCRMSESRHRTVEQLYAHRASMLSRVDTNDQTLTALRSNGPALNEHGVLVGPVVHRADQTSVASHSPDAPEINVNVTSRDPASSDQNSGPPSRAGSPQSNARERLRQVVRTYKLDETVVMFPPPPESRSSSGPDLLHERKIELDMLRTEARRREKAVRKALLAQAVRRLARLDIAIVTAPSGLYTVESGILSAEEIRVLMDPSLERKIQPFLAKIAARRTELQATPYVARALPPQSISSTGADDDWLHAQHAFLSGKAGKEF